MSEANKEEETRVLTVTLAEVRAAFEALLRQATQEQLAALIRDSDITTIRTNAKPEVMRHGLYTLLSPILDKKHTDALEDFVGGFPTARLTRVLSVSALRDYAPDLMQAVDSPGAITLACLQDYRPDVRQLAKDWLEKGVPGYLENKKVADVVIRLAFGAVMPAKGEFSEVVAAESAGKDRLLDELRKKVADLERQIKTARNDARKAFEKNEHELRADLATAQYDVKRLTQEKDTAEARHAKLEAKMNEAVERGILERLPQAFHGWLAPAIAAEEIVRQNPAAPLLEEVQAALAEQRKLDRAANNCAKLHDQLDAVETSLAEVTRTLAAAHVRSRRLIDVKDRLTAERDALRKTLAEAEHVQPTPVMDALLALVQGSTPEQQPELESLLRSAQRLKLIGKDDKVALTRALARLQTPWNPDLAGFTPKEGEGEPDLLALRNPLLAKALRGESELLLYLDGHNILNCLSRYRAPRGSSSEHERVRGLLERDLVALLEGRPLVTATLVWDGSEAFSKNLTTHIAVHYSGGEGEHRADNYILNALEHAKGNPTPKLLVSNDGDFCKKAKRLGAAACSVHDFEGFLPNGNR